MAKKGVHQFLTARALDQYMFGFVMANKKNLPAMSIERSITQFKQTFDVTDQMMDTLGAKRQFIRMQQQYLNYLKSDDKGEEEPS
jgi:hypothetical protein